MSDYTHFKERMKIITEMNKKGWSVCNEKHYRDNYIEITFGKCLEVYLK